MHRLDHWYDALRSYFPPEEMRSREHFQWLITNRPDTYRVEANDDYVLLALDYDDLFYIDYLYVYPSSRGRGIGTHLLRRWKETGKAVLLEVEPANPEEPITLKRREFYLRDGFKVAGGVSMFLVSPITGEGGPLDLFYWSARQVGDQAVYRWMRRAYEDLYIEIDSGIYSNPNAYPPSAEAARLIDRNKSRV